MNTRRSFCCMLAASAGIGTLARAADGYPSRPITWVVPFTPGGITDQTSRIVTRKLGELLGQPFVVDNRAGAGGSLGTEYAARATPDGYTVLYVTQGTMAANLALYKNLKYDPLKDFIPLHGMLLSPSILVVEASRPMKSVAELIAYAKAHPGALNFGSAGSGTGTHLSAELFQQATGTRMTHVPYKGSTPALQDLLGGRVDLMFDYMTTLGPQIKAGKLRPLAVMGRERLKALPDVPTIAELGHPDAVSSVWSGVAVPAGTPAEAVQKLADALDTTMRDPQVTAAFVENGSAPMVGMKLDTFRAFIAEEQKKWGDVVRKSGATIN